ncbi:hypothetical protein R3W88_019500 [Solanum pinnatisectum]|uniref:Uncharacterized protein n=1 Tax=Solanum pinnatisectum TaxID=50273 RepID=A0AAV9KL12_9SOLN|nr:hypothetical protein R3W88_019500 [Solanum pinnatisectum]
MEKNTGSSGNIVTPHDGGRCMLPSLTFGNFLPPKFRSIMEEVKYSSLDADSPTSMHLKNFGTSCSNRKLQVFGFAILGQGKLLSYVPLISKEGKMTYWHNSLIGYIFGDTAYLKSIENHVVNIWRCKIMPQILINDIASDIGQLKHTNQLIASMEHIYYARVCVEVDVSQPLIESIKMVTQIGTFHQPIDYDWKPKFYRHWVESKGTTPKEVDNGDRQKLATLDPDLNLERLEVMMGGSMQGETSTSRGGNKYTPLLSLATLKDASGTLAYVTIVNAKNTTTERTTLWSALVRMKTTSRDTGVRW